MSEFFNLEKLLTFFNYIFWFFMLNIFFSILNIPVILFFLFVGLSNITTYLPLFLVSLIPFGASFTALLYCMRKLVKYKDLDLFSDFIKGLKYNWKQSTLMWCGELFLIFLLSFNLRIFSTVYYSLPLTCVFIVLMVLTFTKPVVSIGNIVIFLFSLMLFEISPGTTVIFMASIVSYLIMFLNKNLLESLETKSSQA